MATFKVGQRVRKVANKTADDRRRFRRVEIAIPVGAEGTVMEIDDSDGALALDFDHYPFVRWCYPYQLAPLTDPHADEFIADMNRYAAIAEKRPLGEKLADRLRFA